MGSYIQAFKRVTHPLSKEMEAVKVILLGLLGTSLSRPQGPPTPYAAPAPVYAEEPPVYNYQYGVSDDYSGSVFSAQENRNNYDTAGEYRVNLPDGRIQIVSYSSGPEGYVADVKYEGEAVFPEAKPYVPAPVVKVAPAPVVKVAPVAVAPAPVAVAKPYVPAPVVIAKPVVPAPAYRPVVHAAPVYKAAPLVFSKPSGYVASPINLAYTPKKYGYTVQEEEAPAAKDASVEPAAEEPVAEEPVEDEAAPAEEASEDTAADEA